MVAVGVVLCHFHRLKLLQPCLLRYLVFALVGIVFEVSDVSNIAYISHLVAEMRQVSEHYVECDSRSGMTEMRVAIDCWTANIHANVRGMKWLKSFFLTSEGIVNE